MVEQDDEINLEPIGKILTGFESLDQCPRSGRYNEATSVIEIEADFVQGLQNIELASHLIVLYWFDKADRSKLLRHQTAGEPIRGVFASRTPFRPNPVAFSVVELIERDGNRLTVSGLDCLDGTSVLDIKAYVPAEDLMGDASIGWNSKCCRPGGEI